MAMLVPSVNNLGLHLPEEQTVFYEASQASAEDAVKAKEYTQLTEYFSANVNHENARCEIRGLSYSIRMEQERENMDPQTKDLRGPGSDRKDGVNPPHERRFILSEIDIKKQGRSIVI